MYGIKDKHYNLDRDTLDISSFDQSRIVDGWWGSDVFRNYIYERPYPFEPGNYKDFLEQCYKNTMTSFEIYDKFGYDADYYYNRTKEERVIDRDEYEKTRNFSEKRFNIYVEFVNQLEAGKYDKTLKDIMEEQGGKDCTDKLLESYMSSLEKMRK